MSGSTVSGRDYISRVSGIDDEQHFTFNEQKTEKNVLVEGDGSTVVNVYYTRNYYTHVTQVPEKIIAENKLSLINRMLEYMITYHLLWWYNDKKIIKCRFTLLNQSLVAVKSIINGDLNNLCKD